MDEAIVVQSRLIHHSLTHYLDIPGAQNWLHIQTQWGAAGVLPEYRFHPRPTLSLASNFSARKSVVQTRLTLRFVKNLEDDKLNTAEESNRYSTSLAHTWRSCIGPRISCCQFRVSLLVLFHANLAWVCHPAMAPTNDGPDRRSSTRIRAALDRRQSFRDSVSPRALRAAKRSGSDGPLNKATASFESVVSSSNAVNNDTDDPIDSEDELLVGRHSPTSARRASLKRGVGLVAPSSPDPLTISPVAKKIRRSVRNRPAIYYEESDSASAHDDFEDDEDDGRDEVAHSRAVSLNHSRRLARPEETSKGKKGKAPAPRHARMSTVTEIASRLKIAESESEGHIENTTFIPPWTTLPYLVLFNTFKIAADLMSDDAYPSWLLETSLVCRDFSEPALAVLYQSPPLLTRKMAHRLVDLLVKDPTTTVYNYRQKVERIFVDVREIASKTYKGQYLDLVALVTHTPRLSVLDFAHDLDLPPFRSLDESLKWRYPDGLFEAMGAIPEASTPTKDALPDLDTLADPLITNGESSSSQAPHVTRLTGWRWNRRLMGPNLDLERVKQLHLTPTFAGLRRIGFLNYQVPSVTSKKLGNDWSASDKVFVESFAAAINALPDLESLTIESSTVANSDLLSRLPTTLRTIQLINCWDVNSEDFTHYLLTRGTELRQIHLRHNQSLSLGFLSVLGELCPNLQILEMDFKCYQHHEFYDDSDPNYDQILTILQYPNWPASMETIQLRNMRKWTAAAAEMFFGSLVDNAEHLPCLRHLELKAMLDIPIRQRSEIRDKWTAELKRVFLREWKPPAPFYSIRTAPKNGQNPASSTRKPKPAQAKTTDPTRRSTRVPTHGPMPGNSSRSSSARRGLRGRHAQSYAEPDSDIDMDFDEDEEEEEENLALPDSPPATKESAAAAAAAEQASHAKYIHGMCEVVDIKLDNQKLTEQTWSMNDFLDSESDDPTDDDWELTGDREADDHYAW